MTARLVDICFVLVAAWSCWKVLRHPAPTPRRRHKNVRGAHPLPRETARTHRPASAPRTPHSIVASGDEFDLALHRFEQARERAASWTPGA